MILRTIISEEKDRLLKEAERVESRLKKAPPGTLITFNDHGHVKYYQEIKIRGKRKRKYLSKKEKELIQKLATKKYYQKYLLDIQDELKAINGFEQAFFMNHMQGKYMEQSRVDSVLEKTGIREALGREDLVEWMNAPYEKLADFPDGLVHMMDEGITVRSKSEELIIHVLNNHQIPFRYDCAIEVAGVKLHPDFILRHPVSGRVIIWEHLGMMDEPSYRETARWKIELYLRAGYTPGIDLILTSETRRHQMDTYTAEQIVRMILR
ncbi:MAG: hypothetical protein J5589_01080 [Firmicutes bacterium]|nr:hypothetical protein [Bacillota bacterium]